jgi:hypothetical protein
MCFGLRGIKDVVEGQIAHLSRDRSSIVVDDLAFLCMTCHTKYDTKNNRVQGYTPDEVRHYRDNLYRALGSDQLEWSLTVRAHRSHYDGVKRAVDQALAILRACSSDVTLTESPVE